MDSVTLNLITSQHLPRDQSTSNWKMIHIRLLVLQFEWMTLIYQFEVEVQNVGSIDGSEVAIVYSKPPEGNLSLQVNGFKRVFVPAGGVEKVKFELNACRSLNVVDSNAYSVLTSGAHTIMLGDGIVSFPLEINLRKDCQERLKAGGFLR
ncbi:hypothetical protein D5086_032546 [Populus alba]|uniref:Uncharacterized protein n=2 Tax=Populus alba TaxID=43335 RepID=A0ACC4ALR2_POPAL|nr:hypothetical protein D5086_0000290830 [Populus alba]